MQSVVILGGAESGVAAALLAQSRGLEVFVSDYGKIRDAFRIELENNNIPFEEKGHDFDRILSTDVIVKSPGVPESAGIVQKARQQEKELISEIEFAYRFFEGKIAAITGSNGKTTTTSLLYHITKDSTSSVGMGGNIGHAFSRLVMDDNAYEWVVLELSSFQLDDIHDLKVDVGILLNITADHLDRYGYEMSRYAEAKWKLAEAVKPEGLLLINEGDEWIMRLYNKASLKSEVKLIPYGKAKESEPWDSELKSRLVLPGEHNLFNAKMAIAAGKRMGSNLAGMLEALGSFRAIEHRMEMVGIVNGVSCINDSKATNVESAMVALSSLDSPIVWIAGGTDKGNEYGMMRNVVRDNVKAIVCLTKDDDRLREAFSPLVESIVTVDDMTACVLRAMALAAEGDTILLSPACASFDLFDNYMDRGNQFKEEINRYID